MTGGATGKELELLGKMDPEILKVLVGLIQGVYVSIATSASSQVSVKLDLPPVDLKLDGSSTYLSWARQIEATLVKKKLESYLTETETAETEAWRTTHAQLFIWLLNSMVASIASTVDGLKVKDIWTKLKKIYVGTENHMRVFEIHRGIATVIQGDRSVHEYSAELERLWEDLDYLSPMSSCSDPTCKNRQDVADTRTMKFLSGLSPVYDQRRAFLLAQPTIPSLDEAIAAIMLEESRMRLLSELSIPSTFSTRSALVDVMGDRGESRRCYNCDEIGHLSRTCPRPFRLQDVGRRGQPGGRDRSRGGRRGGQ